MKKRLATLVLSSALALSTFSTALASGWIQDHVGWWYQNFDGSYPSNGWHWLDGNNDGSAECYYFNESGYCLINTITPDGYIVDANGAWTIDGAVQTKTVSIVPSSLFLSQTTQTAVVTTAPPSNSTAAEDASSNVPSSIANTPSAVLNGQNGFTADQTAYVPESSWSGDMPYVPGMTAEMPLEGNFWTVNINSGKYHGTPYVNNLYPENTRYYSGPASQLESYGYERCKQKGCY